MRKRAIVILLLILTVFTGCDASMNEYYDNAISELYKRGEANISQLDRLRKAGLVTDESYNELVTAIRKQLESIGVTEKAVVDESNNDSSDSAETLLNNVNFKESIRYSQGASAGGIADTASPKLDDKTGSFNIVTLAENAMNELQQKLQYKVYVLRKHPEVGGDTDNPNKTQSLKDIINAIATAKQDSTKTSQILDSYFVYSGRTILDISDKENLILIPSSLPSNYDMPGNWKKWGNKWVESQQPPGNYNILNQDLILTQRKEKTKDDITSYSLTRVIAVRIRDFNKKAIDKVCNKTGASEQVYLINGNKAYLMEYPVWYIKGWESKKDKDGKVIFNAQYVQSDIKINLISGKALGKNGKEIYTIKGDTRLFGKNDTGDSSFVVDGVSRFRDKKKDDQELTKVNYETKDGITKSKVEGTDTGYYNNYICDYGCITFSDQALNSKDKDIKKLADDGKKEYESNLKLFGSIVLRDYLEYSHIPNVVSGENTIAIGRMFRLSAYAGTGNIEIGKFIGKNGDTAEEFNSIPIKSGDLMDIQKLNENIRYKLSLSGSKSEVPTETTTEQSNSNKPSDPMELSKIGVNEYKTALADKIVTSARFPGLSIDVADNTKVDTDNNKIKPLLYGMGLDIDPYTSNLISNWVTVTDDGDDLGSLNWWNVWLGEVGYTYRIDRDMLINNLQGSYNFDITGQDRLILNINTLEKVQKIYDSQKEVDNLGFIKTIFKSLGLVLILYSALLIVAWIYDTNIVAGVRLLGMLTLGKWVAVTSTEELPEVNMDKKHYVTFKNVVMSSIFFIAIGIILNVVGIIDVILLLMDAFSGIVDFITSAIMG